jgi:hypothetical protein
MAGISDRALKTNCAEHKVRFNYKELQMRDFVMEPAWKNAICELGFMIKKTYNDNSIVNKVEYASTLYEVENRDGTISYSYSEPSGGTTARSVRSGSGITRTDVGVLHTHGNYDPRFLNNVFSPQDLQNGNHNGLQIYVATPNGSLLMYDPYQIQTTTIATDIPSDPKDPSRLNNIDPVPLPKDEPIHNFWHG